MGTVVKVQVVTGYVPIQGHPRSPSEYGDLGERLFKPLVEAGVSVKRYLETLDMCWLHKYVSRSKVTPTHSAGDNGAKNTLAYMCVTHNKSAWLLKAAIGDPTQDAYVWLDYGIGHVPGVNADVVWDFLQKIRAGDFAIPGCWEKDNAVNTDFFPCWRFAGGVMVVPRTMVHKLHKAVKTAALSHVDKTKNVWWDNNTLCSAEARGLITPRWYKADHNETMFTEYETGLVP